ncbi:MAG TPA: NusG domain II-containing protein [Oscillospiraceae bacterium]|mgnify:CR=1 FL=1|nr:NusG domain II-containing protein [Oscillospiraceae bacterium]
MKLKTPFLVMTVLALFVFSLLGAYFIFSFKKSKTIAKIYKDEKLVCSISLDDVNQAYTIEIKGENGEINVIEVDKGKIRMKEANCPDGTCVRMGWINGGLLPVVCLPHHVVIEIEGEDDAEKFDDKAY